MYNRENAKKCLILARHEGDNIMGMAIESTVVEKLEQEGMLERLREVCKEMGLDLGEEPRIVFGEGVLLDKEKKFVAVSKNAPSEDISLAIQYILEIFERD